MAWKIEKWMSEVFPGSENIYSEYRKLPPRELAIVCASILDVALAELLSLRLNNHSKDIEEFLGLNGDGTSPSGSFGARIQLAFLLGILTTTDVMILRCLKDLRNQFAHRLKIDFLTPSVLKQTGKLLDFLEVLSKSFSKKSREKADIQLIEIKSQLTSTPEAGEALVLVSLSIYQAYFHLMHTKICRVGDALGSSDRPTLH